jgi:hypothetical protein
MQNPILRLVLGVLIIVLGWCPSGQGAVALYHPVVGDTMSYAMSNGDQVSSSVIGIEEEDDQSIAKVLGTIKRANGVQEVQRYTFIYTANAVGIAMAFPDSDNVELHLTPLILYMEQAGVEDSWMAQSGTMKLYEDDEDSDAELRFFVIGRLERIESLSVKAGHFTGCRKASFTLQTETNRKSNKSRLTIWFQPNIGIIKTQSEQGGKVIESELVAYTRKQF